MIVFLYALGVLILVAGLVIGISKSYAYYLKSKKFEEKRKEYKNKIKIPLIIACVCVIFAITFIIIIPGNMYTVESGEVAVIKSYGRVTRIETPGLKMKNPFSDTVEIYSTRVQQMPFEKWCYVQDSSDTTQIVQVKATVQFYINESEVKEIVTKYGSLETLKQRISTVVLGVFENDVGDYTLEDLVTGAGKMGYQSKIRDSLKVSVDESRKTVEQRFYITFQEITIEEFVLEPTLEEALLKVRIAKAAKDEADQRYAQETARVKAEAEQREIKEKAEALASKIKTEQDAENLATTTEAQALALERLAEAEAVAISVKMQAIAGADSATIAYLEFIAWVEKWDGVLPTTILGELIDIIFPIQP